MPTAGSRSATSRRGAAAAAPGPAATPRRRRPRPRRGPAGENSATAAAEASMAMSITGQRGNSREPTNRTSNSTAASASVATLSAAQPGDERRQLRGHRVPVDLHAGDLAQLAPDHDDRDARHVADQHRPRQQVGQRSRAQEPGQQAQGADQEREACRQRPVAGGIGRGQRRDRDRRHQRGGRLRAHGQLAGRAEQRVHHERSAGGGQPRRRRDARDLRVGHDLGHQVGGHRHAGQHVALQPRPLVGAQDVDAGQQSDGGGTAIGRHRVGTLPPSARDQLDQKWRR